MSFFCPKCGTQLPDGANVCSQCGTPIGAPAPQAPVQQAPVAPQGYDPNAQYAQQPYPQQGYPQAPYGVAPVAAAPKQPANFDLNVGGFFSDFFKNPIDAVTSRATSKFWLMALIFAGAYAILEFILALVNHKTKSAQWGFYTLLTQIFAIAAFVCIAMLLASAMKIKKLDFLSSLSLIGLPFALIFACRLVEFLNTKIYDAIDKKGDFFSISTVIAAIGLYFMIIVLYDFAINANPGAVSKTRALMFALLVIICYLVAAKFFNWMFWKIFDMDKALYNYSPSSTSDLNELMSLLG